MLAVGPPGRPAHHARAILAHLAAAEAPAGEAGLRMARRALQETWLRFAKGAALSRSFSSGLAYASNGVSASAWAKAVAQAARGPDDCRTSPWTSYRSARLLPMN